MITMLHVGKGVLLAAFAPLLPILYALFIEWGSCHFNKIFLCYFFCHFYEQCYLFCIRHAKKVNSLPVTFSGQKLI